MPREESLYPADWVRLAERDFGRVGLLLEASDPEAAGFFLPQGLEKLLKAFLLHKGWELKRIHDLELLLNAALAYDPSLERFRSPCQRITTFYMVERYPLIAGVGPTANDVRDSLQEVGDLIDALRSAMKPE